MFWVNLLLFSLYRFLIPENSRLEGTLVGGALKNEEIFLKNEEIFI